LSFLGGKCGCSRTFYPEAFQIFFLIFNLTQQVAKLRGIYIKIKKLKEKRPIIPIIFCDILIIACFIGAAYFFCRTGKCFFINNKVEQSAVNEVEKLFDTEDEELSEISIAVNPNANKVREKVMKISVKGEQFKNRRSYFDEHGNVIITVIGSLKIPTNRSGNPIA